MTKGLANLPLATPASPLATPAPWLAGLRATPDEYPRRPHRAAAAAAFKHAEHLDSYLRSSPVPPHTAAAFADFEGWLATQNSGAPLILDSGCGTALSTRTLAPECRAPLDVTRAGPRPGPAGTCRHSDH